MLDLDSNPPLYTVLEQNGDRVMKIKLFSQPSMQQASRVTSLLFTLLFVGCGNLAFVTPTENFVDRTTVAPGATTAEVPIQIDFTGSTSARNIVLDGNLNITTAPAAGFVTTPGAGQDGWDRVSGRYPMSGGNHTLTASAEFKNWLGQTQTITKSVQFLVVGPLPDLQAVATSSVPTFRGTTAVDFEVRIYNLGPTAANNVTLKFFTNMPAAMSQLRTDSGFTCSGISGGAQALEVSCSGGSLAGNNAPSILRVTVRPTNPVPVGTNFTLYGYLDSPPAIQESNENNNSWNASVMTVL